MLTTKEYAGVIAIVAAAALFGLVVLGESPPRPAPEHGGFVVDVTVDETSTPAPAPTGLAKLESGTVVCLVDGITAHCINEKLPKELQEALARVLTAGFGQGSLTISGATYLTCGHGLDCSTLYTPNSWEGSRQ